ncbi:MAG TPA: hypothetical protein VE377_10595 [Candidatus Dormibacteraeota bacterium]|nr:hypothetical protein [Candidatus Dormibacteraeota bacterium]
MTLTQTLGLVVRRFPLLCALVGCAFAQSKPGEWLTIRRGEFCVTEGTLEQADGDRVSVDVPKMRAYVSVATAASAEIRFRYGGVTEKQSALGSGQVRSQFGLKLRAQDPCNLVYVIWRVEPESKLVVSVKRNPSEHTSAQCGNRGYSNIKPRKATAVPRLKGRESHTLRAEMKNEELRVFVDNHEVWEGEVGPDAARLEGPVGIRTDNVRLEFEYMARRAAGIVPDHVLACKSGDSD